MSERILIRPASPRQTAQVTFADGRIYEGPLGTPLVDFCRAAFPNPPAPIMAALVEDGLQELTFPVQRDIRVQIIDTTSNDGMRIYQRALTFLLVVAMHELYPQARVLVDHSVTLGGFFCEISARPPLSQDELQAVKRRMQEIVAADVPINRQQMPVGEAIAHFASQGYEDKVRLLQSHQGHVTVYSLNGVHDYFYGLMPPSTGSLKYFDLKLYPPGFILQLPRRQEPTSLPPFQDFPKLMGVFRDYARRLRLLDIVDVGSLNQAIETGRVREAILVAEALHEKKIAEIADRLASNEQGIRLVLIAGPSASGKTTFARRLAIQLMADGLRPFALGLDDYFVDRDRTPRDEEGEYDFEALEAIDVSLFNEQLNALIEGRPVRLRHFDFKTGQGMPGKMVQLPENTILIVEGIHGLNPRLVSDVPPERIFRLYVSALTQLNIDHHNRVPTTDTRMLRRIVRDAQYRGYSAQQTIERWESIRRGEERNIFPYQENADVMFNSALVYELAVLKPFAEPLLLRVPHGTMEAIEAQRLLAFLQWVRPCEPDMVPDNSLLREFIGGSNLQDFTF
ncbi:MAG: nucleoside kinase [Chloroflexi bacterium]|nr:nucleoside kinase [Chloroflexota bacterium]